MPRCLLGLPLLLLAGLTSQAAEPARGFAVVELFTSEGCSSCPPADKVFADLARRGRAGEPIYCVGFHVDYWDKLGWKDEFADNAFTQRQLGYMHKLKVDDVYTPQTIVNGTRQFVGSRKADVETAVDEALQSPAVLRLTLIPELASDGKSLTLKYATRADTKPLFLNLAVTQPAAENDVKAGENKDRKLQHAAVVRKFQVVAEPKDVAQGAWKIELPDDLNPAETTCIGYLQSRSTFRIVAATAVSLKKSTP